ncbi:hypothetical protein V6N00_13920 [Tersicoccus sp. MR15.9]|uniref:hypothetical protein n=1 Tax=Tersicoccus mangrovi TaxID=3121635 RepID=UPI002FE64949
MQWTWVLNDLYFAVFVPYFMLNVLWHLSVRRTRRRYVLSSILKPTCLVLFGFFVASAITDATHGRPVFALVDAACAYIYARDWRGYQDDDDWWSDATKALKRRLRSLAGRSRTVTAPTAP